MGTDETPVVKKRAKRTIPVEKRKRTLTPRMKKLAQVMAKDPNLTLNEAGKRAGYKGGKEGKYYSRAAFQAINSATMRQAFLEEMAKHPAVKPKAYVRKLAAGFEAKKTHFFAHEGAVVDERETVDFTTRLGYLALAAKLGGLEPANKSEITGANGQPLIPEGNANERLKLPVGMTKEELFKLVENTMLAQRMAAATPVVSTVSEPVISEAQIVPTDGTSDAPTIIPPAGAA